MPTQLEGDTAVLPAHVAPSTGHIRRPSWWRLVSLLALALPAVLGVVLLYFYRQQFPGPFATTQDVWGQFGDFVGGALNPFIAWVSLIVITESLRYTVQAIQLSADAVDAARRQAEVAQQHFNHEVTEQNRRWNLEKQVSNEQRTCQLHQTWISAEMHALRTDVWEFLTTVVQKADLVAEADRQTSTLSSEPQSGPRGTHAEPDMAMHESLVFVGCYRTSNDKEYRRLYYSVGSISHFMADVHAMLEAELLDRHLFFNLLGRSLLQWCDLYRRLDFRTDATDNSDPSAGENRWHRDAVRGLSAWLQQQRAAAALARQMGMPVEAEPIAAPKTGRR